MEVWTASKQFTQTIANLSRSPVRPSVSRFSPHTHARSNSQTYKLSLNLKTWNETNLCNLLVSIQYRHHHSGPAATQTTSRQPASILKNSGEASVASNMLGTPLPDRKPHPNSPITPRHQIRDLSKSPRKLNNLKQTELVWWVLLERMQFTFNSLSCSYLLDGNRVSAGFEWQANERIYTGEKFLVWRVYNRHARTSF